MTGYTTEFIRDQVFTENGEDISGKLYKITFYLPGDVTDSDQQYFVKDTESLEDVASKAYYEKQLSYMKTIKVLENKVLEVQAPKAFSNYVKTDTFKSEDAETKAMLKNGEVPDAGMPMGEDLE